MENNRDGMGLLELLVACALTIVIGASVAGALFSGNSAWRYGSALFETHSSAAGALDVMAGEISAMYIAPPGAMLPDTGLFYGDAGGRDELRFHALVTGHSGDWDLCRVGYRFCAEKGEIQKLFNVDLHEGKEMVWQPLVSGVTSLEFFFYPEAGGEAVRRWDSFSGPARQSGRLPEAVGIVLTTRDRTGLFEERKFETRVSVPAAGRRFHIPGGGQDD